MQYALIDNKLVKAGDISSADVDVKAGDLARADVGRSTARCVYCGEWVRLNTAKGIAWVHSNPADSAGCATDRETAQTELYQAIGVPTL